MLVRKWLVMYQCLSEASLSDASPELAAPRPATTIDRDVPCASCGYNLRGLMADWNCPECGTPIRNSLRGDLLEFCDPTWVARLAVGARLTYFGCWGCLALVVGLLIASGPSGVWSPQGGLALLVPHLATTCLFVVGSWWLTSPHRREAALGVKRRARWLTRTGVVAAIAEDVVFLASLLWFREARLYLLLLRAATAMAWVPIFCAYLRQIGMRLDDKSSLSVERQSTLCSTTGGASLVVFVILVIYGASVSTAVGRLFNIVYGVSVIAAIILAPALPILMLNMMAVARKALRNAADNAERNWASERSAT
jgi:hypothetical protein